MELLQRQTLEHGRPNAPCKWPESKTLFLLNCYDIWSATPPRGRLCGDPVPAAVPEDTPA